MKNTTIILSSLLIFFLGNSIYSQKSKTWNLIKSTELNQPFGHLWEYNNSPDLSHKKCKGHEHLTQPSAVPNKKAQALKKTFTVNSPSFKLGYTTIGTHQTKISYSLINETGTVVAESTILIENTEGKKWDSSSIDLSDYMNKNITLVISIDEQPENSSLFINLFQ